MYVVCSLYSFPFCYGLNNIESENILVLLCFIYVNCATINYVVCTCAGTYMLTTELIPALERSTNPRVVSACANR